MIIFRLWHNLLGMNSKNLEWHEQDVLDELNEYKEAKTISNKWSELSDVVYTVTRARWDGYGIEFPISKSKVIIGAIYMFPKITGRWLFFYRAGKKAGSKKRVTEVRNPIKVHKLHHIAEKYELNSVQFEKICKRQLKYWPLLK